MACREIAFDLETTGLDPVSGHRIVEIGCVELIDRKVTGEFFHSYVNPQRDMPRAAQNVHGLSSEFLEDKPLFKDVMCEFLEFVAHDKLVIHNAAFDMGFINYQLQREGKVPFFVERAIDTLTMARKKFPGAKATLDALCSRYGISTEARVKHGALLDSELLAEVYIQLMGGYQGSMNLEMSVSEKKSDISEGSKKMRKHRHFPPTQEEIEQHTAFKKALTKA